MNLFHFSLIMRNREGERKRDDEIKTKYNVKDKSMSFMIAFSLLVYLTLILFFCCHLSALYSSFFSYHHFYFFSSLPISSHFLKFFFWYLFSMNSSHHKKQNQKTEFKFWCRLLIFFSIKGKIVSFYTRDISHSLMKQCYRWLLSIKSFP